MTHKNILISGCSKGIGFAIAELFAQNGFNVAGCARNSEDLQRMQNDFQKRFPEQKFIFKRCDVADANDVKAFGAIIINEWKHIDILVNNAGIFLQGTIQNEADGVLENLLTTNVHSAYHLTRAILPSMTERKAGSIFNMCSVASIRPYENGGSYCISKFALLGFSKQLREEMKPHNIKVTAVLAGATYTNSWAGANIPESRFIPASDIAKSIFNIYNLSATTDVEEILIRPQSGDI